MLTPQRPAACMTLHDGIIYGPIHSRRFGVSLGVNLLPPGRKVCSFNCVYCQYSWTEPLRSFEGLDWPSPNEVATAVREALGEIRGAGPAHRPHHHRRPRRADAAPRSSPASWPRCAPFATPQAEGVPVAILSNSTMAHLPHMRDALAGLDERNMKLDAGRQEELRQVNACGTPIEQIVDGLAATAPTSPSRPCSSATRAAASTTRRPRPSRVARGAAAHPAPVVQIYTIDRPPALASLVPVDRGTLEHIAARVAARASRRWSSRDAVAAPRAAAFRRSGGKVLLEPAARAAPSPTNR